MRDVANTGENFDRNGSSGIARVTRADLRSSSRRPRRFRPGGGGFAR
jgi:hypothetical protein